MVPLGTTAPHIDSFDGWIYIQSTQTCDVTYASPTAEPTYHGEWINVYAPITQTRWEEVKPAKKIPAYVYYLYWEIFFEISEPKQITYPPGKEFLYFSISIRAPPKKG